MNNALARLSYAEQLLSRLIAMPFGDEVPAFREVSEQMEYDQLRRDVRTFLDSRWSS